MEKKDVQYVLAIVQYIMASAQSMQDTLQKETVSDREIKGIREELDAIWKARNNIDTVLRNYR